MSTILASTEYAHAHSIYFRGCPPNTPLKGVEIMTIISYLITFDIGMATGATLVLFIQGASMLSKKYDAKKES